MGWAPDAGEDSQHLHSPLARALPVYLPNSAAWQQSPTRLAIPESTPGLELHATSSLWQIVVLVWTALKPLLDPHVFKQVS